MRLRSSLFMLVVLLAGCISINTDKEVWGDPEVAMVIRIANLGEVREGELARDKATDPAVRDFGSMMVADHSTAASKAESELSKAEIVSTDTELSKRLDAESGAATERLRAQSGKAFDRAYIDRQVQVHQDMLQLIASKLTPAAKKKVVKDQLASMKTLVEAHLAKAKSIAKTLQ